jgi:polysaccharide export outer membrane protein
MHKAFMSLPRGALYLGWAFAATVILAQAPPPDQGSSRSSSYDRRQAAEVEAILPSQKIGPGDLVSVSVADCPEMSRNFRVSSDGMLALPLLQEKIRAAGKEPDEVAGEVSEALVRDQILVRPVVSVAVVEYRSVPVSVLGAVKKPVTFQAVGPMNLMDALTRAEGLSLDAGPEVLVSRPSVAGISSETPVQRISIKGLIDDADPALNIRLYGGEEIRVPPAGRVYVLGNVKKSGSFPITDNNDTTVMKVIALSEGLLPFSGREAFIYRREPGQAKRSEIQVDINDIMRRRSADVQLEANDILYIPDNHGKKVAAETLERLASFGSSTASGLLIWH